jgi:uncharacterized protein YecE (DUF72 family)
MAAAPGPIHIGTSGWSYNHWKGPFYPADLPGNRQLEYYAHRFHSVEINSTFYRLPETGTLRQWYADTPAGFIFAVKASRYITHMKKLCEPRKTLPPFLDRIRALDDKLGPILFQLPPRWHFNARRLADFLRTLSREFRYAFEFRDRSWLNPQTVELLSRHQAAFCIYELEGFLTPPQVTTDLVYVRLHGPDGAYQGNYDHHSLANWSVTCRDWASRGFRVYCYFDNDQSGYAVGNAAWLQDLLARDD